MHGVLDMRLRFRHDAPVKPYNHMRQIGGNRKIPDRLKNM